MNRPPPPSRPAVTIRTLAVAASLALAATGASADPASDLAARLAAVQEGTSFVRLRFTVEDPPGTKTVSHQLQIKERRTGGSTDVLVQVLWPKEQKGEAVLLQRSGDSAPTGYRFTLPDKVAALKPGDLEGPLLGGDLAIQDLVDSFFSWERQALVGTETIDGRECRILESKPGSGQASPYGSVRSWIDPDRLVPLRVEKFDKSGQLVRRIDTTRVHQNDNGHHIPATMTVRRPGATSVTELEGSRNKVNVRYEDDDFTVRRMADLTPPRS